MPHKTKEPPAAVEPEADGGEVTVEQLQAQLAERDEAIAGHQAELDDLNARVAEKDETIAAMAAENDRLRTEAGSAEPAAVTWSGERRAITYLGRPDMLQRDEEGDLAEEDVYISVDHADGNRSIRLGVGDSVDVSAEKAAQLQADFPDAFKVG